MPDRPSENTGAENTGAEDAADPAKSLLPSRQILSVSELTRKVRTTIEGTFGAVWLTGEVSGLRTPASGHIYLTLKDANAQIRAVIWSSTARFLKTRVGDGDQVLCRGRLTVYEPRGDYQITIDYLEPAGAGALYRQFEEVRARLAAEGLFDAEKKRPLPAFPRRVALVTSATGAALHDMLTVLARRAPGLSVLISPAKVQGADAPLGLIAALAAAAAAAEVDVVIIGRGGGSPEDLAAFNAEGLARAIRSCPVPVISGVGHETDVTIADLAADLRAATPSAAAELVSASWAELGERTTVLAQRLTTAVTTRLATLRLRLQSGLIGLADPGDRLRHTVQRVDDLTLRLGHAASRVLMGAHARLSGASGKLDELSPMAVLARGFAVVKKEGKLLTRAQGTVPGDQVDVRLFEGELTCKVEQVREAADITAPASLPLGKKSSP